MASMSTLDSVSREVADEPLAIGKRDLERAFHIILEQLGNKRRTSSPLVGLEEGKRVEESRRSASNKCCCEANSEEMPSFSLSFSGNHLHCCTARSTCCRTADDHRKVLQIQLPESSKDPCQILITSHGDQVSVKHLKKGQQFTFSTNSSHMSHRDSDQMFSNTVKVFDSKQDQNSLISNHLPEKEFHPSEKVQLSTNHNPYVQNTNPLDIVIQDVRSERRQDILSNDNPTRKVSENLSGETLESRENGAFLEENQRENSNVTYNVPPLNDPNCLHPLPSKEQKKQSLNSFIDSLLDKRAREANRKSLEERDGNLECINKGEPAMETGDETCASEETTGNVTVEQINASEPVALFPSETLKESMELSIPQHGVSSSSVFCENGQPLTTVIPVLKFPTKQTVDIPAVANKPIIKKGRFKCQYCNELFLQRSQCLLHISQRHVEERPHHCPLCDATFKKKRSLKYHLRHHNGERPFKCTYCDKAFKEKYHLTVHIRTHTGERPFTCTQCGKAFKQTNELTSHIRTHTGERPYKCNMCDKWFKRKPQLYNHKLSHLSQHALQSANTNESKFVPS